MIGVGSNDNNNYSSASENYGVVGAARDATTNFGLHGSASGSSATNYGVYGTATSTGSTNYAGYFAGDVTVTGTFSNPSDSSLKFNIQTLSNALQVLSQLTPKTFQYKTNAQANAGMNLPTGTHAGLIAQDVMPILPSLVKENVHPASVNINGQQQYPAKTYKAIDYTEIIPYLVAGLNELKLQVDALQPNPVNGGGNQNRGIIPSQSILLEMEEGSKAILYQNEPNPFNDKTIIRYYIPETVKNASLVFYSSTGVRMKEVILNQKGEGQVEVETGNSTDGIYSYSLLVDGKNADTKRMVKNR